MVANLFCIALTKPDYYAKLLPIILFLIHLLILSMQIPHNVPDEYHIPPLYKGSCDNLFCQDPPCFARDMIKIKVCVFVFKKKDNSWTILGYRFRQYEDHLECGCKQCKDITEEDQCINTRPCPTHTNVYPTSYCDWSGTGECICRDCRL